MVDRVNALIESIKVTSFAGIGEPEPLKYLRADGRAGHEKKSPDVSRDW